MTVDKFCENLSDRFANIGAPVLSDIRDYIADFAENSLDLIWSDFMDSYDANYAPRRAAFVKIVGRVGVTRVQRDQTWQYVCYVCTAKSGRTFKYPIDKQACPVCGNHERPLFALIDPRKFAGIEYARKLVEGYRPDLVAWKTDPVEQRLPYADR